MKLIAEHLGEIIVALAGVALLIAACVVFKAEIGEFFNSIVEKLTGVGGNVLNGIDVSDLNPEVNG